MAKIFNLEIELDADGVCVMGQDISIDNSDANKLDVTAANEAAMRYKCELADCRLKYGSRHNIERVIAQWEWNCATHPLERAMREVYDELSKLEKSLKPCDYVERPEWWSITASRPARRTFDEWKESFLWWCFKVPLEDIHFQVVEYEREEGYRY